MNLELKPALGHIFNADTGRCEWCDAMDNQPEAEGPCLGRLACPPFFRKNHTQLCAELAEQVRE